MVANYQENCLMEWTPGQVLVKEPASHWLQSAAAGAAATGFKLLLNYF